MKSEPRRLRRNCGSMSGFGLEIIPDLWHVRSKKGPNGKVEFRITSQNCKASGISKEEEEGDETRNQCYLQVSRQNEAMGLPDQRWSREDSWGNWKKDMILDEERA